MKPTSKGPFRPIYMSILYHPRFQILSSGARSLWLALKLRLGPSGFDRLYLQELEEISGLERAEIDAALEELRQAEWIEVEGSLYWMIDGFENEPLNRGETSVKSVRVHLDGFRGPMSDRYRERYVMPTPNPRVNPTPNPRVNPTPNPRVEPTLVKRDRDRERKRNRETIGGKRGSPRPSGPSPPDRSTDAFLHLVAWLGNASVLARAAALWDRNTPTWPQMILDRYGPKGDEPKAPKFMTRVLSDLVAKTRGILHTRSLEAFVHQAEQTKG